MLEKYFSSLDYTSDREAPYVNIHAASLEKVASASYTPPTLLKKASELVAREDGRYVLINAMGAGEFWGANRNGDYFNEWSLKGEAPPEELLNSLKKEGRSLEDIGVRPRGEYGLETFVSNAHVFRDHVNHDPKLSFGDVVAAAYNDRMHRVELILFIRKALAPDVVDKIDSNIPVAFSMGTRLLRDVCSVCGKSSNSRANYCEHLKSQLNQLHPSGVIVCSRNYFPKFFDISVVGRPADPTAYALQKIASEIAHIDEDVKKTSAITKFEVTEPAKPVYLSSTKTDNKAAIAAVAGFNAKRPKINLKKLAEASDIALNTCTAAGILLKESELLSLYPNGDVPSNFDSSKVSRTMLDKLATILDRTSLFMRRSYEPVSELPSTHNTSIGMQKYARYLHTLKTHDIESCTQLSAKARFNANTDDVLEKVATMKGDKAPIWLPFVFGILSL